MRRDEFDDEPYVVIEKHADGVGTFLIGLAVGAGVALLFAPRSGAETRRDIRLRAERAREAARDAAVGVTERVTETFEDARDEVERRIDGARQAIDLKKRQVQHAMHAGRAAAQQARDDLERRIAETKAAYNAGADVARAGARGVPPARVPEGDGTT